MNWLKEVAQAHAAQDVLALAGEYLQGMPRFLRESLSLPESMHTVDEVFAWHSRLADVATRHAEVEGVHEVAVFFVRAAARLLELGATRTQRANEESFSVRRTGLGSETP